jgi:hypothetical protein
MREFVQAIKLTVRLTKSSMCTSFSTPQAGAVEAVDLDAEEIMVRRLHSSFNDSVDRMPLLDELELQNSTVSSSSEQ